MTISSESIGSGFGILYEDTSGGFLSLEITHVDYTSTHKFRVRPFGSSSSGVFNAPPSGTTANIGQEADNLATLIAAMYGNTASGAFTEVNQVLTDNTGVQPYPYTFGGGAAFSAGTASGGNGQTFVTNNLVAKGTDGSRWLLMLPGVALSEQLNLGRFPRSGFGTALAALADYLLGVTNGPTHAVKTNVVSHSGVSLAGPIFGISSTNKRLRRHFKVA
jgi:hypothetical protein